MSKQIKFIRFGGLSPVKQEGYSVNPTTFHQPPARYGIYCFPESGMEKFLLSTSVHDPRRMVIDKNKDHCSKWKSKKALKTFDALIETDREAAYAFQKENMVPSKNAKPRKFSYTGELWHHLDKYVPIKEIIKRHGSWVLTTYSIWVKAYQKNYVNDHAYSSEFKGYIKYSKDHLECFIENPS